MVIKMTRAGPSPLPDIKSYLYCKFANSGGKIDVKIIKQSFEVNGTYYVMEEVYGINENKDCVICLTEPVNTVIEPCKHMCLCHNCADELEKKSRKCPMCRQVMDSYLRLNTR
eukprot:TRINITY_DN8840_c0_g1_i2.p1 TRINITY_DN8840_c0_g1~~TRINITY_DN8840_c0_g1_i2.p1  ORF type:complete len:113 (-),score=17.41 TRINITY_DN8840_c0_g1_i2:87-425(-)